MNDVSSGIAGRDHSYGEEEVRRDFERDVWCLFGLPVDNLDLETAIEAVRERTLRKGPPAVLSTINVNWVVQSLRDAEFRQVILNSEIVTLDGRPLVWLARLLSFPMIGVVAGSTLVEELNRRHDALPLTIFLFGGQERVAETARRKINSRPGGLRAVGALNPGFGPVEEMSGAEIIEAINRTTPDILLVALGAGKGTRWIEKNRKRLDARIVSHLGATVNFLAGTVERAPNLIRNLGMEWIWRILQEPKLFSRYLKDGLLLLGHLLKLSVHWFAYRRKLVRFLEKPVEVLHRQVTGDNGITIYLGRNVLSARDPALKDIFCQAVCSRRDIVLDLGRTEFADGAFWGQLLLVAKWQRRQGKKIRLANVHQCLEGQIRLFRIRESLALDESVNS